MAPASFLSMVCALHWDAPLRSFRSLFTSLVISSSSQFVQLIHCRLRLMTLVVLRDGLSMLRMFMFMTARLPGATNPSRNLSTCQHVHTSTLAPMWQRQSVKDTSGRTSRYTHEERANTGPKSRLHGGSRQLQVHHCPRMDTSHTAGTRCSGSDAPEVESLFQTMDMQQSQPRGPEGHWALGRLVQLAEEALDAVDAILLVMRRRLMPQGFLPIQRHPSSETLRWNLFQWIRGYAHTTTTLRLNCFAAISP